ncbi:DUF4118 domain-containing protein [Desertibaculum subflavum]|uniref:DUF4118 domain-containing protein n=1 Tax=Desertibaculum subflavum TaxID=2268458 RepID=UPI000E672A89
MASPDAPRDDASRGDGARPSPEALLDVARREGRGRLKIYLGAAPGVGKTFAMLEGGHGRRRDGVDVVVGVVETHGRRETEALIQGLDVLPRQTIPYRGQQLAEFDLDAALARRPRLILIDELAHTNAPGSRHPKRYQDVEELLAAGIDVYTTLNVQHLESLNDVVARITRVRVRETLPDEVLQSADEVELVDLTPGDLIKRLAEGKVYVEGQAKRAVAHFFKPGNITALRELALRRVAERVDDQMVDYMRQHAIAGPWAAGDRLLACIGPDTGSTALVRATRRLADQLHAPWTAVYVEMPGHYRLNQAARDRINEALRLAEQLDGEAVTLPARDLVEEVLRYAGSRNVTQIVIGRRRTSWLRRVFGRSLVDALVRASGDVAVHVVPLEPSPERRWRWLRRFAVPQDWPPFALSVGYVVGAVAAGAALEHVIELPSPAPLFLVAVVLAAVRHGLWPSVVATAAAFLGYNFFFTEPRYTFTVARPHELVGLFLFLLVAILVSGIAARVRDQAIDARQRVRTQSLLLDFSRKLVTATGLDDLLWAASYQIAAALQGQAIILLAEGDDLRIAGAFPPEEDLDPGDWMAARWAWGHGEAAGHGTDTLPNRAWRFEPMRTARGRLGAVGLRGPDGPAELDAEQQRVLAGLIDQTALAVERSQLDREMAEARVLTATEKLRDALLSSVSHDLKTPLASIIGAVTSLKSYGAGYDAATRADLLDTIQEEAERLGRFVRNLLDMTRLESGMLAPRLDWVAAADLVAAAARRARRELGDRPLEIKVEPDLPLLKVDSILMEQVLFNLLDNAAKYSPAGSAVEIAARREGTEVVIAVADRGQGIPAEEIAHVFEKFRRVARGDRQVAGTGLGLAVCRGIVEAHGGHITAQSPRPGGLGTTQGTMPGTLMRIALPVVTAPKLETTA